MRSLRKRRHHLPTVCSRTPSSAATDLVGKRSAQEELFGSARTMTRHTVARTALSYSAPTLQSGSSSRIGYELAPRIIGQSEIYNQTNFSSR
jgi:hypothetical protein